VDAADELVRLRAEIAAVRADVDALTTLTERVRVLADRVAELAAARTGRGEPACSWFGVGPDLAESMLVGLARWVYDVLGRYRLGTEALTDCWHRHPAAVEALLGLRAAWEAAGTRADGAIDWHVRALPGVLGVVRDELRGCSESNHAAGGEIERYRRAHPRVPPDEGTLRRYAAWWAVQRGEGPEPDAS
jgi:hypothetical protein